MFNLKLCHDVIYFAYKITVFSFYLLVRKLVAISNMINHNMYEPRHDEYVLNRGLSVTVHSIVYYSHFSPSSLISTWNPAITSVQNSVAIMLYKRQPTTTVKIITRWLNVLYWLDRMIYRLGQISYWLKQMIG